METQTLHVEHKGQPIDIPYVEMRGARDGPRAFISGVMHGNEINGIAVARRFLEWAEGRLGYSASWLFDGLTGPQPVWFCPYAAPGV